MSRCLSSSVILPPSNPSCPITPQLPCHPVPDVNRSSSGLAISFSSLSSAPRIAFAAVIVTTRQRPPPQWDKSGKQAGFEEGFLCIPIFAAVLWFYIHIIFILYPPFISFATSSLYFHRSSPASLRLFGSNGFERQSLSTRPTPLPTKKYKPT